VELNTRGRYAVMAMADLGKYGSHDAVSLSAIAERQQLSIAYLEQIFAQVRRAGLVESVRGRSGGYRLARPAPDISIAEIMTAVEEETRMTRCLDIEGETSGCLGHTKCQTHGLWHALGDHIRSFLASVSLQDVIAGAPIRPRPLAPAELQRAQVVAP
jgi:Rrf2 family transcriptional regulator, iron-sulfur cluster assembly transcription factor